MSHLSIDSIRDLVESGYSWEEIADIDHEAACQALEAGELDDDYRAEARSLDAAQDRARHSGGMDIWRNEAGEYCCG